VAEGLATFVGEQVRSAFKAHPPRPEVGAAIHEAFRKLDYAEYGGAPLLGVTAPVLIGHGRSSPHAIMNMLKAAKAAVAYDVTRHIIERIGQSSREVAP
jgi:glycerol-3-phosphate acyltransferase PlsX